MNFLKTAWKVRPILEKLPETRDCDRKLICEVWRREISNFEPERECCILSCLEKGDLEHPETIRRTRQKLQEVNPALRGKKWEFRHNMEADVVQQLTFFNIWEC